MNTKDSDFPGDAGSDSCESVAKEGVEDESGGSGESAETESPVKRAKKLRDHSPSNMPIKLNSALSDKMKEIVWAALPESTYSEIKSFATSSLTLPDSASLAPFAEAIKKQVSFGVALTKSTDYEK